MRIRRYRSTPLGFRSTTERMSKKNLGHLVRYSVTKSKAKTWAALFRIKVFSGWGFSIWQSEKQSVKLNVNWKVSNTWFSYLSFIGKKTHQTSTWSRLAMQQICLKMTKVFKQLSRWGIIKWTKVLMVISYSHTLFFSILTLLEKSFRHRVLPVPINFLKEKIQLFFF